MVFTHPELHISAYTALPGDLSPIVGDDSLDLLELLRFNQELK
jgi:hypothetical protein